MEKKVSGFGLVAYRPVLVDLVVVAMHGELNPSCLGHEGVTVLMYSNLYSGNGKEETDVTSEVAT